MSKEIRTTQTWHPIALMMHEQGAIVAEIAKAVGKSDSTVHKYLAKNGITPNRREFPEQDRVIRLALAGRTVRQIAEETGRSLASVRSTLYRHRVPYQPENAPKGAKPLDFARKYSKHLGSIAGALLGQDDAFLAWLADQVPEGGTAADVLVAVAIDTYQDEKELKHAA